MLRSIWMLTNGDIVPYNGGQHLLTYIWFGHMNKGVVLNIRTRSDTDAVNISCKREGT